MIDISKETIEIECESCNSKINITLQQVADEVTVKCSCGTNIKLIDDGGKSKETINKINRSFNDLDNAFKKLGNIKF